MKIPDLSYLHRKEVDRIRYLVNAVVLGLKKNETISKDFNPFYLFSITNHQLKTSYGIIKRIQRIRCQGQCS